MKAVTVRNTGQPFLANSECFTASPHLQAKLWAAADLLFAVTEEYDSNGLSLNF